MKKAFVDVDCFTSRNRSKDGNIEYKCWFDKTIEEKLAAAVVMMEVSYKTKNFIIQKVE